VVPIFRLDKLIGILENNREKEEDLVARVSRVIGIDRIPGSPAQNAGCRSIVFRTGRDAGAYQNREVKSQSSVQTLRRSKPVQSHLDITSENEYNRQKVISRKIFGPLF
jgi:hypothetical protein